MEFGLGQFTLQLPPWDDRTPAQLYADTLDLAAYAESCGFASFWLAEHHGAQDSYIPSTLPFLSAVAARTTTMKIGTAVLLAPLHHPIRVAEDAAVVDALSGGRLRLGLGLGWVQDEYRTFGVPMKGRGKRLEEFVQILRSAWTGERFTFHGKHYSFDDVAVTPRPAQGSIPIYLGGGADAAIERAAVMGDGHFPASVAGPQGCVDASHRIAALRRERGLDKPYRFGSFVPVGSRPRV
jgi:probable F420-dependent oxidoreductase